MGTTIALLLHYYPGLTLKAIYDMSKRQLYLLVNEVSNVNEIFNGDPKKKKKKMVSKDLENAKKLGCKTPERLIDVSE